MSDWEESDSETPATNPGFRGTVRPDESASGRLNSSRSRGRGRRTYEDSFDGGAPGHQVRNGFDERTRHDNSMWGGGHGGADGGGGRSFSRPAQGYSRGRFNDYERSRRQDDVGRSRPTQGGFGDVHRQREFNGGGGGSGMFANGGSGGRNGGSERNAGDSGFRGSMTCFNCGDEGHQSRDCPNSRAAGARVPSSYVPVEESCENLFKCHISAGINFEKYKDLNCEVSGSNPVPPIDQFEDSNLRQLVKENVARSGFRVPTPVQKHAIPIVVAGRDLMACAQTGSGKTGAFLLPIVHALLESGVDPRPGQECQTPEAVVIAPTRELAIQIHNECRKFAHGSVLKSVVVYGGTAVYEQKNNVRSGVNVLVATVGRLKQFVEERIVSFSNVKFLVLDEADRMLDLGFMDDIETLVKDVSMPTKSSRQTLMFSATFPSAIQGAARNFLKDDYLFLKVGIVGGANSDVLQTVFEVSRFDKQDKLLEILRDLAPTKGKVLIFTQLKKSTDFLATYLCQEKFMATSIHGDRLQPEREAALGDFKAGRMQILVATAVAARGLDIEGVSHVINYDLPGEIDEYVHRIGRTGRVGNTGTATSFYDKDKDSHLAKDLVRVLADSNQTVEEWLSREAGRSFRGTTSGFGFDGNNTQDIRKRGGQPNDFGAPAVPEEEEIWD